MISINTHRLYLSISGPPRRKPPDPIIVFIAGAGDVASSYCAVQRLVASFSPLVLYDRSGLGRSECNPNTPNPTATSAAAELHTLLTTANVPPPLILAAHSYGAIIAREYLHLYSSDVAGMVLMDASTERNIELFQNPDLDLNAMVGNLRFAEVTGLRAAAQLSREEWKVRAMDIARGMATSQAEAMARDEVCRALAEKEQFKKQALGDRPLSVIRCNGLMDYRRLYEKAVEAGNGTEAQRAAFRELLEKWDGMDDEMQEEQLRLSRRSRVVHLPDCGHNVHLIRPEIVAEEIRWVREQILGRKIDSAL
jgi:pimeloyl-ACP methyl ester carboxylesterase